MIPVDSNIIIDIDIAVVVAVIVIHTTAIYTVTKVGAVHTHSCGCIDCCVVCVVMVSRM